MTSSVATVMELNALRRERAELIEDLRWIANNYANQDLNHVDFRVEAGRRSEASLSKAEGK